MSEKIRIGLLHGGGPDELAALSLKAANAAQKFNGDKYEFITLAAKEAGQLPGTAPLPPMDVVIPFLNGEGKALWQIHGVAERAGVPFVGPDWKTAALGSDRLWVKKVLAHDGLPQGMFRHFTRSQWEEDQEFYCTEIEVSIGYPCKVQPASGTVPPEGCQVRSREELEAAVASALQLDSRVVVEEFLEGRRFQAALLGGARPEVSDIGEVTGGANGSLSVPKNIPAEQIERMKELAAQAYASLDAGGAGLVRMVLSKESGLVLLEDWETFPHLTPDAPYAKLWRLMGVSYAVLLDRWIELAIQRQNRKSG
jgi:D-alanine-D-alanine ligase